MRRWLKNWAAVFALFGLGALAVGVFHPNPPRVFAQDEEGQAARCDNNRQGKSKDTDHTCACEHADESCNPRDPDDKAKHQQMSAKCKTYCRPEACGCESRCTS